MTQAEIIADKMQKGDHRFRAMKLMGADFSNKDLKNYDFRGASLIEADFTGSDLTYANLDGANCYATKFDRTILHRTNFANANLSEASMMDVQDCYGVTITLECKSFQGLKLSPGWWWGWIFYALLMSPQATPSFIPEKMKDELRALMGADRFEVLRRSYSIRGM